MSSILLMGSAPIIESHLRTLAGAGIEPINPPVFPDSVQSFMHTLKTTKIPDLVLLAPQEHQEASALSLVNALSTQTDAVVAVIYQLSADPFNASGFAMDAFRAGASEVISASDDLARVRDAIARINDVLTRNRARLHEQARQTAQDTQQMMTGVGEVIVVMSSHGGIGKTTLATNLAIGIAGCDAGASTVLVDGSLQFGDVAAYLEILATRNTLPVVESMLNDPLAVKTALTLHESGLYVLPGSTHPAGASKVTPESVAKLVEVLANQFPYVVIDTATGLRDENVELLRMADRLLVVTTPDVATLRSTGALLSVLKEIGYTGDETLKVCMNFADETGISDRDVEATLGRRPDWKMPTMPAVRVSTNLGIPVLVGRKEKDPARRAMANMVKLFHNHDEDQAKAAGRRAAV